MIRGVDYYPEQWDEKLVDDDLETMLEMGINTIRIGEFAWCRMEKEEGNYDFSLFDRVIEKAKNHGLQVIFGTPTATLPAWLAKKHPEVLSEFENGRKRAFGGRRNYCFNSPSYQEYCDRIVTKLVSHYKLEDGIVAWQIDNEFGHEGSDVCFCDCCHKKFQEFLSNKYKNIAELNEIYGTIFWSQEYSSFDEIPQPLPTITTHNPSLRMDWELFRSNSVVEFGKRQVELIKDILPNSVVFHDFSGGGMKKQFDFSAVAETMDLVAYNNYPVWGGQKEPIPPHDIAFQLSYIRGLKQKNFMITEAIMGAQGHDVTGYLPRPNQAKMWSYQAVAHGCSDLMYFRYRSATKGAEQFCYGILDGDNVKRRKFYEVESFFEDVKKYEKVLESPVENRVCFLTDYPSMASFRIQKQSLLLDYEEEMKKMFKPFHDRNVGVDIIPSWAEFEKYDIVILSLMTIWYEKTQERVKKYTKAGGLVVLTYRTAVKDQYNNLSFGKVLPTNYDDLLGGCVFETESVQEFDSIPLRGNGKFQNKSAKAGVFREFIEVSSADVLFYYDDQFYQDYPAVTYHDYGKGACIYMGTSLFGDDMDDFIAYLLELKEIPVIETPEGVELVERVSESGEVYQFMMNHTAKKKEVNGIILQEYESKISKKQT